MKLLEPSEATKDKLTSIGYGFLFLFLHYDRGKIEFAFILDPSLSLNAFASLGYFLIARQVAGCFNLHEIL